MRTLIFIILFLITLPRGLAQGIPFAYRHQFAEQVRSVVETQFGGTYSIGVEVIDSVLGSRTDFDHDEITDPSGTLNHCILFSATRTGTEHDSTMFGVFRNGSILWHTDPIIPDDPLGTFATADINNDGNVEILTTWFRDNPTYQWMWIFGWNGASGTILSQIDPTSHRPVIQGTFFELIDADGDGVQEIRASHSTDTSITYSWNGNLYGLWPTTQQVPRRTLLPANRLIPSAKVSVSKPGSNYDYSYCWADSSASKQSIAGIYLRGVTSTCTVSKPQNWLAAIWPDTAVIGWNAVLNFNDMVKPGESKQGFGLSCSGLPIVVTYYVQGNRPVAIEGPSDQEITTEEYRDDIFNNSVAGFTIGPGAPPAIEPYASLAFTDTLLSYTKRSRALGWILDQPTADKYTGLFNRIHSDLDQQQKTMALLRVDTVLSQVHQDSATHLTSEAYALLRFNAEYLRTLIAEDPLPIQLWYFTATVIANRHVKLEWGTLSEQNNYGFFAQKSQSETTGFTDIPNSFVAGHGTTTQPHEYSWIDTSTSPGRWYYRLKQVDFDGTLRYTDAERVYIPEELHRTEIVNFKAGLLSDNSVYLEWMTLSEYLCEGFYVQRKADGEEDFQDVNEGFVQGHGTTNEEHLYSFTDTEVKEGKWYYRLKHQGDGTEWYSDTIHVPFSEDDTEMGALSAEPLSQLQVRLDWSTRREVSNGYFEVQVSRGDSLHYRPVPNSRIPGHGTSTQRWKYTYRDTRSSSGVWYYSLKQVNASRQARYTRGIRVSVR